MALTGGTRVGHYEILSELGAGGMGTVYLAHDPRLMRNVAVKVLSTRLANIDEDREQLVREARAAAALNHPHICTIHDVGTHDGRTFVVMELLEGETLAERIGGRPLPIQDVLKLGVEIADALAAAHGKGIVHRDIKPSNVFITVGGLAKVLDFGLAQRVEEMGAETTGTMTNHGVPVGTLPYMAPERIRGTHGDARTDVYALGALLYEMTTGRRPFPQQTALSLIDAILHSIPPAPSSITRDVPPALDRLISSCLSRDVMRRSQSMHHVISVLNELLNGPTHEDVSQQPKAVRSSARKKRRCIRSIAVLPLSSLSDTAEDYFIDGMTEALITNLARLGELKIISRTSVMRYKGTTQSILEIARDLAVDAVVEGSVFRVGNRVRISAQLIDAARDEHIWADSHERDLDDVLTLQREVALSIANAINVAAVRQKPPLPSRRLDPEAHEAYLKGRFHFNKRTPEGFQRALEFFTRAVHRDPTYAPGYAGLADCYILGRLKALPRSESIMRARIEAQKALEFDDSLAEAHASLASVASRWDWDWAAAERGFDRAVKLNPGDVSVRHRYSFFLAAMLRLDEALVHIRCAAEIDPLSLVVSVGLGRILDLARRHDEAIEQFNATLDMDRNFAEAHFDLALAYRHKGMYAEAVEATARALALSPNNLLYHSHLAHLYGLLGRRDEAGTILERLETHSRDEYISPALFGWAWLGLGEKGRAVEWLGKMFDDRAPELIYLGVDPGWDSLRSEPQFRQLLARIGLPSRE
jgi:serine/threonine-protein kinase